MRIRELSKEKEGFSTSILMYRMSDYNKMTIISFIKLNEILWKNRVPRVWASADKVKKAIKIEVSMAVGREGVTDEFF